MLYLGYPQPQYPPSSQPQYPPSSQQQYLPGGQTNQPYQHDQYNMYQQHQQIPGQQNQGYPMIQNPNYPPPYSQPSYGPVIQQQPNPYQPAPQISTGRIILNIFLKLLSIKITKKFCIKSIT